MKKKYICPEISSVEVEEDVTILAGSDPSTLRNVSGTPTESGTAVSVDNASNFDSNNNHGQNTTTYGGNRAKENNLFLTYDSEW